MSENENHQGFPKRFRSPESVRLLWEGTRKALDGGIDTEDLVSLCRVIVRLADDRLLILQSCAPSAESQEVAEQLQHYRKLASDLLQWATKPAPEPDWASLSEKLKSVGDAPLDLEDQPR